jgi:hypothetical protein
MMRQVTKDGRFADARLAAHLERKACVECREGRGQLRSTIQEGANQPRTEKNRRGTRTMMRAFARRGLADHGAARVADLQGIATNGHVTGDRAVNRGLGRLRVRLCTRNIRVLTEPVDVQLDGHSRRTTAPSYDEAEDGGRDGSLELGSRSCDQDPGVFPVQVLANELRGRYITVNAVAPGSVATELFLSGKTEGQIGHEHSDRCQTAASESARSPRAGPHAAIARYLGG